MVVCDYTTHLREGFPLRSITTTKLITHSCLIRHLHRELGITANLTSCLIRHNCYQDIPLPFRDSQVEWFNQTLKIMLRKLVSDPSKNWSEWLPFLLFAYREVPQVSTGFSLLSCSLVGPFRDRGIIFDTFPQLFTKKPGLRCSMSSDSNQVKFQYGRDVKGGDPFDIRAGSH